MRYDSRMTTNTKYTDNSKLYRMLEGIGRDMKEMGVAVRNMNDTVSDLLIKTDSIYDAVSRHPDSRLEGLNDDSFWGDGD